jgi:predicted flap endonuclease-1-like 5' DNA nuclease
MGGMENDLWKLKGIGPQRTAMLEQIGVDSIKELQHRNPDSLLEMIASRYGAAPGVGRATVADWIEQAKRIYRGDS